MPGFPKRCLALVPPPMLRICSPLSHAGILRDLDFLEALSRSTYPCGLSQLISSPPRAGILRDLDFLEKYRGRSDVIYAKPCVQPGTKASSTAAAAAAAMLASMQDMAPRRARLLAAGARRARPLLTATLLFLLGVGCAGDLC